MPIDRHLVILDQQQIKQCLSQIPLSDVIQCVRGAFEAHFEQRSQMPERSSLHTDQGTTLFMPAYMRCGDNGDQEQAGIKIVSVMPQNESVYGLPNVPGFTVVVDCNTGLPKALMDASLLTGVRTAAGSALSLQLCAPQEGHALHRMLVFGAGTQAYWHIVLCLHVLRGKVDEVVICNRTRSRAETLARELVASAPHSGSTFQFAMACHNSTAQNHDAGGSVVRVRVIDMDDRDIVNAEVSSAGIICTCTNSSTPLFDGTSVRPGTHIMCVGSYTPSMQEVDETTIMRSRVVADSTSDVWRESGDLIIPLQKGLIQKGHILASIAEISLGKVKIRQSPNDITLFKSVGVGITDTAISEVLCKFAISNGLGTRVPFP